MAEGGSDSGLDSSAFPLSQGEQPAVGNAQLPLESGLVFFQLLSSLDPLENSASLSLEGRWGGGQGSCRGHLGQWSLPVSMESLDFGPACLWCLCVFGQGQGTQLLGLRQGHSWSGMRSQWALRQRRSCSRAVR